MKVFVLNRKYVYMFICLTVLTIALFICDIDLKKVIQTSSSPIANRVIVLDAGHRTS